MANENNSPRNNPNSKPASKGKALKSKNLTLLQIVLVYVGAIFYWFVFLMILGLVQLNKIDLNTSENELPKSPGQTWLLIGSDSRDGVDDPVLKGAPLGKFDGQRSDTILIMSTPKLATKLNLTSIPRDLLVTIPARDGKDASKNKINAAYAFGGPELIINTVQDLTGVRMDHYAEIGFVGLVNVVNSYGGITVCPTQDFSDEKSGLEIKEGCQKVNGLTSLAYSRARYSDPRGDLGRVERQQEVVKQIMKKTLSPFTLLNIFQAPKTISAIANAITVDKGVGPFDLIPIVLSLKSGGIESATLPTVSGGNVKNVGSIRKLSQPGADDYFKSLQEGSKVIIEKE
jgi:LCP family protein required for cell wall assembly